MAHLIDADKLIIEVKDWRNRMTGFAWDAVNEVLEIINSLQQEQQETPKGKLVFPKFLYARTLDNKTIDVSYAPQNMDAIEYVRNDFVEQEQPEVDLEKEVKEQIASISLIEEYGRDFTSWFQRLVDFARHFYSLGINARKEE